MNRAEIIKQINLLFIDILDNKEIILSEETTASDIEEWDSLTHILIVVAIEKEFKVRFTSKEIQSWDKVGDMINSVVAKIPN